ncbi:hypothetical protein F4825DRAFT_400780 [Nemania diffusa]|nr:hypothetical protein F4825DRAFT_400780 [Nemania diffusa]
MSMGGLVARGVPVPPSFFIYIVGLILLLSVIILALAAYAESLSGNYYYESGVPPVLLFVSIWTWLVYRGMLTIEHCAPRFYYRIGVFIGQLLSAIFWIVGWAWAASWADYILSFDNYSSYDSIRGAWKAYGQTIAACASIGALVWVLCIVALAAFCYVSIRRSTSRSAIDIELVNASKSNLTQDQTASPSSQGYTAQPIDRGVALLSSTPTS